MYWDVYDSGKNVDIKKSTRLKRGSPKEHDFAFATLETNFF